MKHTARPGWQADGLSPHAFVLCTMLLYIVPVSDCLLTLPHLSALQPACCSLMPCCCRSLCCPVPSLHTSPDQLHVPGKREGSSYRSSVSCYHGTQGAAQCQQVMARKSWRARCCTCAMCTGTLPTHLVHARLAERVLRPARRRGV